MRKEGGDFMELLQEDSVLDILTPSALKKAGLLLNFIQAEKNVQQSLLYARRTLWMKKTLGYWLF